MKRQSLNSQRIFLAFINCNGATSAIMKRSTRYTLRIPSLFIVQPRSPKF
jgi:hypothetical protein